MHASSRQLVRLALGAAQSPAVELTAAELAFMVSAVQMNALQRLTPEQAGAVLVRALMAPYPEGFFRALRACCGLGRLLPELEALFGSGQYGRYDRYGRYGGQTAPRDMGEHQLGALRIATRRGAVLAVRFAVLVHRFDWAAAWPVGPGRQDRLARAAWALAALDARMALPADALELAALVMVERDHMLGAGGLRAGAVAALFERVQAHGRPRLFEQLLEVCLIDWCAFPGREECDCVVVQRLRRAQAAWLGVSGSPGRMDKLARMQAVARALGPED